MDGELQTQPLAGVLATSQVLDILKLIFPKKNRQKINQYLYTNYRNYEKSLDIKGLIISYAGQPGGIGYQHEWNVDATQASVKVQSIFRDYLRSTSAIVPTPTQTPGNQGHQRDRLFLRQGILCSRFTAQECEQNSDEVVAEFLELIEAFSQNNSKS